MFKKVTFALALMLAAGQAVAAGDWIDELPTVTVVAQAVDEQLKVDTVDWRFDARGIALEDDDDLFAVYMVGTFVHLRKIILFQYQAEQSMSRERETKLRSVVAAYLEAELLIGQAVGTRRGYLTTVHKCRDIACYRRWFKNDYSNVYISASYRGRILRRLFPCDDRAAELDRLAQSYAGRTPFLPSPAETLSIPPEVTGVAPAGCSVYGGDANRNGLCDDWKKPLDERGAAAVAASTCAPIVMEKVRLGSANGLVVTLAKNGGKLGATASFRVSRSSQATIGGDARQVWTGDATIQAGTQPGAPLQVILAQDRSFRPDPTKPGPDTDNPWLIVEVTSGRPTAPVSCGRPLPITKLSSSLSHNEIKLFGPYPDVYKALFPAGYKALALTGKPGESGFVILRRGAATAPNVFYATTPAPASQALSAGTQPLFHPEDYRASIQGAFRNSCEELASFGLIGTVHTHPSVLIEIPSSGNFSMNDFNEAIRMSRTVDSDFGGGVVIPHAATRGIFLIPWGSLEILMFIANPEDPPFDKEEIDGGSLETIISKKYDGYKDRQKPIGRYPQSIKN